MPNGTPLNPHIKLLLRENQSRGKNFQIGGSEFIEIRTTETTGSVTILGNAAIAAYANDAEAITDVKNSVLAAGINYYNREEKVFKVIRQTTSPVDSSAIRKAEVIPWNDVSGVTETTFWLGGKVHGRQPDSDDVFSANDALIWFNARLDDDSLYTQAGDFTASSREFHFFDEGLGEIVLVTAVTATDVSPGISPEGASVIVQGLCEELPHSSKRTRDKWVDTETVMTEEGWHTVSASKDVPYRLKVVDADGALITEHNIEAVLQPYVLWVKTPVF